MDSYPDFHLVYVWCIFWVVIEFLVLVEMELLLVPSGFNQIKFELHGKFNSLL